MNSEPLTRKVLLGNPLPDPNHASDKNSRGRVLAIAGSVSVPGAALLAGVASLRSGAGKVQLAVPPSIGTAIGTAFPECGILPLDETEGGEPLPAPGQQLVACIHKANATLVGPGLMDAPGAASLVITALEADTEGSFVLDALALCDVRSLREALRRQKAPVVLTPHHGEMATLLGIEKDEVSRDPAKYATNVAAELQCCVVLKSDTTYIAAPTGALWRHDGGVIGLATAGSGDVLAGIITGLIARGADPVTAALWGVFVHGKAGTILSTKIAPVGFLAREILDLIPGLISRAGLNTEQDRHDTENSSLALGK